MTNETQQWHHFNNAEAVAHAAVHRILLKAQESISHRGIFKLVLAGGTTPKRIYELLSEHQQEWSKWHLFIGDERCLDNNDPERNSLMIKQSLLDKINFPEENFHPINAQLGPEKGASEYAELINTFLPFDLSLLGIGEDGHTASLFPGHQHDESQLTHAVYNSPKAPPERVSLSKKTISQSAEVIILVTGKNKQSAVRQWQQGEPLPVAQIQAARVSILIDDDAQP
ncbi:MAG: 6-phosphogluconolactonase [gamma proteobacterium symbiont of Lucinoma myriamae]|nr:6-phosphogluconolactonase [gamma proteobacterium symbiont of Lucinoma myriamae]MCU7817473.1 6-phosphogluconolactonase [gamma proteobacterium symbiont of Lucinoma myriamae]MCU7831489.1 6-phosphogluconolactonase [gamma proteobacterium symbiont of Lucinoma myriamae]